MAKCSLIGSALVRTSNRRSSPAANMSIVAETLERRGQTWTVRTEAVSDLIIQVGDCIFHLHKLPIVSRSVYLNRLVFGRRRNEGKETTLSLRLDDFPGGAETFALVAKFCYGWKVDLTAANIVSLYCAARFLEMSDDLSEGNLMSKTETFLAFVLFASWKDIFIIFRSCEEIPSLAKDLNVLKRCSEAVAWKACIDPKTFAFNDPVNKARISKYNGMADNWWFEDVASLRIDHFAEVIESIQARGMRSELVGSCIAHWTSKWLSQYAYRPDNLPMQLSHHVFKDTAESLIRVLPKADGSMPCNFLLHLLKLGLITKVNSDLLDTIEARIARMLEKCSLSDIMARNFSIRDSHYDVQIVAKVVAAYASALNNPTQKIVAVGRLVDEYLGLVARDEKLPVYHFQELAEALPRSARYSNDNLYRAIDMYLKTHPNLTEEERTSISRAIDHNKLSQEARKHAMINDRLPLAFTTRLLLLEQVNMTRSVIAAGSNYQRTMTQTIISVSRGSMTNRREIIAMRKEVEDVKLQLKDLEICKVKLQKQAMRCTV